MKATARMTLAATAESEHRIHASADPAPVGAARLDFRDRATRFRVGVNTVSAMITEPVNTHAERDAGAAAPLAGVSLIIAHGASGDFKHPLLAGFAHELAALGAVSLRFNFVGRQLGNPGTDSESRAVDAWQAARAFANARLPGEIWASGKSFGGRMAALAAARGMPTAGLLYLGFPLHAPGKSDTARGLPLSQVTQRQVFIQGSNDPFASREAALPVIAALPSATVHWVEGGGHSFAVAGDATPDEQIGAHLATIAARLITV